MLFLDQDSKYDIDRGWSFMTSKNEPNIICGEKLAHKYRPLRSGKDRVEVDEWPVGYYYPDYCLGSCAMMSSSRVHRIAQQAMETTFGLFTMADILFTGILRINSNSGNITQSGRTNGEITLTDASGLCRRSTSWTTLKLFYEEYCRKNDFC